MQEPTGDEESRWQLKMPSSGEESACLCKRMVSSLIATTGGQTGGHKALQELTTIGAVEMVYRSGFRELLPACEQTAATVNAQTTALPVPPSWL